MPLISPGHWQIASGDSWGSIAAKTKVDRTTLAQANGAHLESDGVIRPALGAADVGRVIHVPFQAA